MIRYNFKFTKRSVSKVVISFFLISSFSLFEKLPAQNHVQNYEFNLNIKTKEEAQSEIKNLIDKVSQLEENDLIKEAISYLNKILILEKKFLGEDHPDVGETLEWIGMNYADIQIYDKAEEYLKLSLALKEKNFGLNSIEFANTLNWLAVTFHERSLLDEAENKYLKVLSIQKNNEDTNNISTTLYNLGRLYQDKYKYIESEEYFKLSLKYIEDYLEIKSTEYIEVLDGLASLYYDMGLYKKSENTIHKALKISKNLFGENNNDYLSILIGLGNAYAEQGLYEKAEQIFVKILNNKKNISSENKAATLNNLGLLYTRLASYDKAAEYLFKSLEIEKEIYGEDSKNIASNLNNIALNLKKRGDLKNAKKFILMAINIYEKNNGIKDPLVATSLDNLALIYQEDGLYTKAEEKFINALEIKENTYGNKHPSTAISINNLALNYILQGLNQKAEKLLKKHLALTIEIYGEYSSATGISLNNLALVYEDPDKSIPLLKRSLKISKKVLGENHPEIATSYQNLALEYEKKGLYSKAEDLLLKAIKIDKKVFGERNINIAIILDNLAQIYIESGLFIKAENLLLESLSIREENLTSKHPYIADNLIDLGNLYFKKGLLKEAIKLTKKGVEMDLYLIQREAPHLLLSDRTNYISEFDYGYNQAMQFAFKDKVGTELALFARLNRQGLLEEIEKRQSELSNLSQDEKNISVQIKEIIQKISSKDFNKKNKHKLEKQKDKLEKKLYSLLPKLKPKIVKISDVSKSLSKNSLLIEYQKYNPFAEKQNINSDKERYLAFMLFPNGEFKAYDLGSAEIIDKKINEGLLASENAYSDAQKIWNELSVLIFQPLIENLNDNDTLFISPDSELNRVPFAALSEFENKIFINEKYNIRLLTTGRELIDLKKDYKISKTKPLIVANPKFDLEDKENFNNKTFIKINDQLRSKLLNNQIWESLPGTELEGKEINKLTRGELLIGDKATAYNIQNKNQSKLIHIASHAYYLDNSMEYNPLLKSGIVLAGANNPDFNNEDDGYLTALEISKLDWKDSELVVISACESGLGDIKSGEGVYGIKRAIAVAGARSSLLSLWKVNDIATAAFMKSFYSKLIKNNGRAKSLAETQEEFRRHSVKAWRHPNVWAAFQLSGDWRPIDF